MDDGGYILLGFIIGFIPMFFYVNAYGNGWRPKKKNEKDGKIDLSSPLTSIFAIFLGVIDGFKDDK